MSDEGLFYTLHGMAVDALERMEAERDALRARAEAAEAEVARLRAELAQARAETGGTGLVSDGGSPQGARERRADCDGWTDDASVFADCLTDGHYLCAGCARRDRRTLGGAR